MDPASSTDAEAILRETGQLLSRLDGADLELLRAVIAPRRERLVAAIGAQRADPLLGEILIQFVLRNPA
jgi:hypothetical protein